ncbi:LutC/YkgG family protein [Pedococcus bigeumensis]|jgi:L-lactate dehydrogenase complex protein LldG|uniref:LutC/YkgG family protein n=1 Tax=Pedococcus bigeumensis TaxID=433644 RepID=UPI002FE79996
MGAREDILQRIREANEGIEVLPVQRDYRRGSAPTSVAAGALVDLLEDRLVDYRATVVRCRPDALADSVRGLLAAASPVLRAPGVPQEWCPGAEPDHEGLGAQELDRYAAVLTAATVACAETGTIALDASPDQGRRAITLIPDLHVCVVRTDQVVASVPEMLSRLAGERPITFISGPSATSDIELDRVEGVHGPRTLCVVLVETDQT